MKISERKVKDVSFIKLNNEIGLEVELCSLGAGFYRLATIDKNGKLEEVILTPTNLDDYYANDGYHGKVVGRYSGRIDKAKCKLNGKEYNLDINWNNVNSLHGGFNGISFANFNFEIKENDNEAIVIFKTLEKANKLPGDISYEISYLISKKENNIRLCFKANTTEDTICNLTNHAYFNLTGNGKDTILNEVLQLNCDSYTRLNNELITLSIDKVNKVMDFTSPHKIGDYINDESLQNHKAFGYDHCFIKTNENEPVVAILKDEISKRQLTVSTSYPAIVCYSCNYPSSFDFDTIDAKIKKHHAICLECQYVPNGINMEGVNKAILKKNETYQNYINYHFDIVK